MHSLFTRKNAITKSQCQSPRQNANVNLVVKVPMSIPSPKCTIQEALTPSQSRCPRAGLIQNCPTFGILRPLYLLGVKPKDPVYGRDTCKPL